MNSIDLTGKTALITGGNKGIGFATSQKLASAGAKVISLSKSNFEPNYELYPELKNNFIHYQCDLSNNEAIGIVLTTVLENKQIDFLINNAGVLEFAPFVESDITKAYQTISVNLQAAIWLTYEVLPMMIERSSGMIINISSIGAIENFANCGVYNASKAGLLSFSRSIRKEVRKSGIKIIDIIPGATLTDIWDKDSQDNFGDKMMLPEDIANAIYSCISLSYNNRLMIEEIVITPQNGSL